MWQLRCGGRDEGIVFGVARLAKPRSKSASAQVKPGGFEAPETIPSSPGLLRGGDSFRSGSDRASKNSLLMPEEFLDAKKLRTLQGANQNSSLRSSDSDLLEENQPSSFFG